MKQEFDINVDKLLKWISALYILATVGGAIYISCYYWVFNINIFQYIQVGEVILQFVHAIPFLLFHILLIAAIFLMFKNRLEKFHVEVDKIEALKVQSNQYSDQLYKLRRQWKRVFMYGSIVTGIILVLLIYYLLARKFSIDFWGLLFGYMIVAIIVTSLVLAPEKWFYKKFKIVLGFRTRLYSAFLILYFWSVIYFALFVAFSYRTKELYTPSKEVEFFYDSQKVNTSDSVIFVGMTLNYIFLYNRVNKVTSVFEKEIVKGFRIKDM